MGGEHESSPLAIDFATDWTGLDDPDNPRNFHRKTRIYSTVSVTVLAFVTTFAASVYSPGIEGVSVEFDVSHSVAVLPLSLYNLGLAAGPILGSPLSETWGRKIVLLITTPGFMVFTMGAALSSDIVSLTVCRFFAGVFAAPAVGNASASICDYTSGSKERCRWHFTTPFPRSGLHWGLWLEASWYKPVAGGGPNGLY
jgi:DHA1 family multidrug resistance protein-like MFS transporter